MTNEYKTVDYARRLAKSIKMVNQADGEGTFRDPSEQAIVSKENIKFGLKRTMLPKYYVRLHRVGTREIKLVQRSKVIRLLTQYPNKYLILKGK